MTAERLAIKEKIVVGLNLDIAEQAILTDLPALPDSVRRNFKSKNGKLTIANIAAIVMAVADSLLEGEPMKRLMLLEATDAPSPR